MKLLVGLLACLALLVGCGGDSTFTPKGVIDKTPLTSGTKIVSETRAAISTPTVAESLTTAINKAQPVPKTVIVAMQETTTPTPRVVESDPRATPSLGSSTPCEVLTGDDKDKCQDMVKNATDLGDITVGLCASFSGVAKDMCEEMVKTGTDSQHGSGNSSGMSNQCAELSGDNKTRCEKEIANDPIFGGSGSNYVKNYDPNNIPKIAKFNFSELDKLGRMSKFRSVTGHDFSFNTSEYDLAGTSCRSMKHYMIPVGAPRKNALVHVTPHTFEWMSIKFFAPADGVIGDVIHSQSHGEPEQQFTIESAEYPGYYFGFYHVKLDPNLRGGSPVKAGQQVGTLGNEESYAEISVEARVNSRQIHLLSFLQVATDEVFEEYKARGVNSVLDVIITREERDANPIACDRNSEAGWFEGSYKYKASEAFMTWAFESSDNWVFFD